MERNPQTNAFENKISKCRTIINSYSVLAGTGNLIPLPGVGMLADIGSLTMMARDLATVLGNEDCKNAEAAKAFTIGIAKRVFLKYPIKIIGRELARFIPFAGQIVAGGISVAMTEAVGWAMVKSFTQEVVS
jgi:uncharacterized protein (DUF697 family)